MPIPLPRRQKSRSHGAAGFGRLGLAQERENSALIRKLNGEHAKTPAAQSASVPKPITPPTP